MTHPHNTRDWSAKDHGKHELVVHGQVQTLNTGEHPKLVEAVPQGINPKILILTLEVPQTPGPVGDIVSWKEVTFHKHVAPHEFQEVEIMGDVEHAVTVKVALRRPTLSLTCPTKFSGAGQGGVTAKLPLPHHHHP